VDSFRFRLKFRNSKQDEDAVDKHEPRRLAWEIPRLAPHLITASLTSNAHRFGFLSMIVISLLPPSSVNRHYEQHQASNGFCLAMINFFSAIVRVAFQLQVKKIFSPHLSLADCAIKRIISEAHLGDEAKREKSRAKQKTRNMMMKVI
jgi:hypothetical protein